MSHNISSLNNKTFLEPMYYKNMITARITNKKACIKVLEIITKIKIFMN